LVASRAVIGGLGGAALFVMVGCQPVHVPDDPTRSDVTVDVSAEGDVDVELLLAPEHAGDFVAIAYDVGLAMFPTAQPEPSIDENGAGYDFARIHVHDLDEYVYEALSAGASGFLLKDGTAEALFEAVRVVAAGDALLTPNVTRRLIDEFVRTRPRFRADRLPELTARELDVLRLMAIGRSNSEIAAELYVGTETVKTHVSRILAKLGARDRTQAVIAAYRAGLVQADGRL
jgi:DNA-binding NarL/FixJ family response regulator